MDDRIQALVVNTQIAQRQREVAADRLARALRHGAAEPSAMRPGGRRVTAFLERIEALRGRRGHRAVAEALGRVTFRTPREIIPG
jgi:hypothetical protein